MIVDTGTRVSDLFVDKDIAVHASSQKAYVDLLIWLLVGRQQMTLYHPDANASLTPLAWYISVFG
jgi:hypothetical protein